MTRRPRGFERSRGFSLLELIVAFAILSVSLAVLYRVFSASTQQAMLGRDYSNAVMLAESRLAELAARRPIVVGEETGAFNDRYRWKSTVHRYRVPDTALGSRFPVPPYEIAVEVSWGEADRPHRVRLDTIRLVKQ